MLQIGIPLLKKGKEVVDKSGGTVYMLSSLGAGTNIEGTIHGTVYR